MSACYNYFILLQTMTWPSDKFECLFQWTCTTNFPLTRLVVIKHLTTIGLNNFLCKDEQFINFRQPIEQLNDTSCSQQENNFDSCRWCLYSFLVGFDASCTVRCLTFSFSLKADFTQKDTDLNFKSTVNHCQFGMCALFFFIFAF